VQRPCGAEQTRVAADALSAADVLANFGRQLAGGPQTVRTT
jgi:hypothetical protein